MNKDAIQNTLLAMFSSIERDNQNAYEALKDLPAFQEAGSAIENSDPDAFYFALIYPLSNVINGLLSTYLGGAEEAKFLFKHHGFVEGHFRTQLEQVEGHACVADKTQTIIRHLVYSLVLGKKFEFDYGQEYTFHLPKVLFKTQDENVEFFRALMRLYYGNPDAYLKQLVALKTIKDDSLRD